jgi:uncharacterized protein (TIRG00374 family)
MGFDYKNIVKILIAIFLIAFIVYNLKIKVLIKTIIEANMLWIVFAGFLLFIAHLIIVYRIKFVLTKFRKLSTGKVFWSHFFSYLIGQITPGKIGYLSMAYLFKKEKIPYSLTSSVLILSQLISFVIQMILAGFCVIYLASAVETTGMVYMILILGWVLYSIIITLLFLRYGTWKLSGLIKRLPKGMKLLNFIESLSRDFSGIKRYTPAIFIFTLLSWIVGGIAWWAIGMSLDVNLPFYVFILLNPLVSSLTFFPITPAGIGIAEAGNVLIFSYLGILPEKGFIFMLLDRSINLIISLLGLKVLVSKRVSVSKR